MVIPSKLGIEIPTSQRNIKQARLVPRQGHYVVEIVYERKETQADVDPALIAAVDIGVNNLAALTSNKLGFTPLLVNGRPVKSTNQYYNKRTAELQRRRSWWGYKSSCKRKAIPAKPVFWIVTRSRPMDQLRVNRPFQADGSNVGCIWHQANATSMLT